MSWKLQPISSCCNPGIEDEERENAEDSQAVLETYFGIIEGTQSHGGITPFCVEPQQSPGSKIAYSHGQKF